MFTGIFSMYVERLVYRVRYIYMHVIQVYFTGMFTTIFTGIFYMHVFQVSYTDISNRYVFQQYFPGILYRYLQRISFPGVHWSLTRVFGQDGLVVFLLQG